MGIIILLLGGLYLKVSEANLILPDLSGGLFVEVIGAILTFALIDRVIQRSEERKRVHIEKLALKSFRFTIIDLLNIFWNMRRAAAKESLTVPPANWREAITSDAAIDDLKHLDFLSDAGMHPTHTWNSYIAKTFQENHLPAIRRLIDSYAPFLSERAVEKLEALNSSALFCRVFLHADSFSTIPSGPEQLPILAIMEDDLRAALKNVLSLVDLYNELCPESRIAFEGLDLSENVKPLLGTGRVESPEVDSNMSPNVLIWKKGN